MATYVTKQCPYCYHAYQVFQSGEQRKYGCPLLTCVKCNKTFFDADIKEPALHGYENLYETHQSAKRGCIMAFYIPTGILLIGAGIGIFVTLNSAVGFIPILMAAMIFWPVFSYINKKIYEKKHAEEIWELKQKEYDASIVRLQNYDYVKALAEYDPLAKDLLRDMEKGIRVRYAPPPHP